MVKTKTVANRGNETLDMNIDRLGRIRKEPVSLINLIEPNGSPARGGLSNPDPVVRSTALNRSPVNLLIDEFTSSEKLESPFDLWARLG
jgi:hypothetical protein